ncbi:TIGR02536 family ethanolamine utilization protein [Paraclostridium bifermentans]|uniref:TIGR02536 family ethanolamine utilization protein n=1 Tax=Paraclostridium bifermentans TaxID=1490 RepID=UPI001FF2CB9F|nr:TIGR02536 family ethanolamine utilization protein [Paraclostridium bifermentans]UOW68827.1 TIGR02536 family ethanolamine utilization protein [Paraclostridium bifermentans]
MDYDKLIEFIVDEIYKKLENQGVKENNDLPKCVLMWERDEEKYKFLNDKFKVLNYNKDIKDCDVLVISRLCLRGLCNLAMGNSVSDEERFILKMIMSGKKVYVMEGGLEYKRYKQTAPKTLYNKYLNFEKEIKSYGVEIINNPKSILNETKVIYKEEYVKENKEMNVAVNLNENTLDLRSKKLISESDLRKPQINGIDKILLGKRSIITPLANDFIRIHNLKVDKK